MWENFPQDTNRACSHLVPQTLQEHALLHVWMQRLVPPQVAGITIWQCFLSVTCFVHWQFPQSFPWDQANPGGAKASWTALVSWQFQWFWEVSLLLGLVNVVVLKTAHPWVLWKTTWPGSQTVQVFGYRLRSPPTHHSTQYQQQTGSGQTGYKQRRNRAACSTQASTWQENASLVLWEFSVLASIFFPQGHLNYMQMFTLKKNYTQRIFFLICDVIRPCF